MDIQIDEFDKFDDTLHFKRARRKIIFKELDQNNFLIAGAILAGAALSYRASKKASQAQQQGSGDQIAEMRRQYDLTREDLAPFRALELEAAQQSGRFSQRIEDEFTGKSQFKESPGYKFRVGEATQAVGRQASAQGRLNTPSYDLDLARNIGGQAGDEYQRYLSNLFTGAGMSPATGATSQTVQSGERTAGRIGQAYGDIGASRANRAINEGNIASNVINQGAMAYGYRMGNR